MRRNRNKFFFLLSIAAFITSIITFIIYSYEYHQKLNQADIVYHSIQKEFLSPDTWSRNNKTKCNTHYHKKAEKKKQLKILSNIPDIQFKKLRKCNPDIYAWIIIPNTSISYPVLQHPKKDIYYLNHNIDGSTGYPGCIFSKKHSKKDFTDSLIVLYGHNMRNKTMFGALRSFYHIDFAKHPKKIYLITPTAKIVYEIKTSAGWGTKDISYTFANTKEGMLQFLHTIQLYCTQSQKKKLLKDTQEKGTPLLVLSTCGSSSKTRFLIIAQKEFEWRK